MPRSRSAPSDVRLPLGYPRHPGLVDPAARPVGRPLVAVAGRLMLTAYLLYYLGDEDQRFVVSVLPWSVGLSRPVVFLAHRWRARAHPPGH